MTKTIAPWLLVPLAMFLVVEAAWRAWGDPGTWYQAAETEAARGDVDTLFIGSSRVAAAIDVAAFDAETAKRGRPTHARNLGMGSSTMREHLLGVRNVLAAAAPKKVTVFLEAPEGIPDAEPRDDPWSQPRLPAQLIHVMHLGDLPAYLRSSASFEDKVRVTLRLAAKSSAALSHREAVRDDVLAQWSSWCARAAGLPRAPEHADLKAVAGIHTDAAGIAEARALAASNAAASLAHQERLDYEDSLLHDFVDLVHSYGGDVVVFTMPMSDLQAEVRHTAIRDADRAHFDELAKQWNVRVTGPFFDVKDDDFPDAWHLRASLAPSFSQALAHAWLR